MSPGRVIHHTCVHGSTAALIILACAFSACDFIAPYVAAPTDNPGGVLSNDRESITVTKDDVEVTVSGRFSSIGLVSVMVNVANKSSSRTEVMVDRCFVGGTAGRKLAFPLAQISGRTVVAAGGKEALQIRWSSREHSLSKSDLREFRSPEVCVVLQDADAKASELKFRFAGWKR